MSTNKQAIKQIPLRIYDADVLKILDDMEGTYNSKVAKIIKEYPLLQQEIHGLYQEVKSLKYLLNEAKCIFASEQTIANGKQRFIENLNL